MSGHGEHESHAGITAEIRARAGAWMDDKLKQYDERLADRLDAAHKREIDELRRQIGDTAKLREALMSVKKSIDEMGAASLDGDPEILLMSLTQVCARLSARIDEALAAPPRNCDVGTATEQTQRYCRELPFPPEQGDSEFWGYEHLLRWAQMPYEEGGAK